MIKRTYGADFTIDFEDLESKITPKITGICVANYFGHMLPNADAAKINALKAWAHYC